MQFLWRCVSPCDLMPALALCIFKALYHQLAVVSSQEPPGSCSGTSGTMQSLSPSQMTQALQGYLHKAGRVSVIRSDRREKWEEVQWQESPRAFLLTWAENAWITQPQPVSSNCLWFSLLQTTYKSISASVLGQAKAPSTSVSHLWWRAWQGTNRKALPTRVVQSISLPLKNEWLLSIPITSYND